jgi:hypothetical protein
MEEKQNFRQQHQQRQIQCQFHRHPSKKKYPRWISGVRLENHDFGIMLNSQTIIISLFFTEKFWTILYSDYKDVAVDTITGMKEKPRKAAAYFTGIFPSLL